MKGKLILKATIQAGILKDAIQAMSGIINECRLQIGPDGINARAVGTSNAVMAGFDIPKESFGSYVAEGGTLGIDLVSLERPLNLFKTEDLILIKAEAGRLSLTFGGNAYSTQLLDVNTIRKDPNLPTVIPPAKFKVSGAELAGTIRAIKAFTDTVHLVTDPKRGTAFLEGSGNVDSVRLSLNPSEVSGDPAATWYSLDYILEMVKTVSKAETVEVSSGVDMILRMELDLPGCHVRYVLAPRVEVDEVVNLPPEGEE